MVGTSRGAKGFEIESSSPTAPVRCRDVRGFATALQAARGAATAPDRLVLVVPDVAMDAWLARWANDPGPARRTLTLVRRTDGARLRIEATLLTYGWGVDTALGIVRLVGELPAAEVAREPADSRVRARVEVERGAPGALQRKIQRG